MWLRLDDRLYSHPKVDTLSNAALGLWTRALSWTGDTLTDGFIPNVDMRRRFKATPAQIQALVDAELWIPTTVDGVAGWYFHNFDKWNEPATRAGVEKRRSKSRTSSKNHRERSRDQLTLEHSEHTSESEPNHFGHTSESEVNRKRAQNEHSNLEKRQLGDLYQDSVTDHSRVTLDPTRPDPTRTKLRGVEVVTVGSPHTRDDGAAAPGMDRTDTCSRHAHIPPGEHVPPCNDCRDRRLANDRYRLELDREASKAARTRRECPWCDETGWLRDDETGKTITPVVRCDHQSIQQVSGL